MKTFPMFLKLSGRRAIVIGGGEQAAQKARLVIRTDAALVLVAETLEPELADLVATGRAIHASDGAPDLFKNAALVFVATGCKGADAAWQARAKAAGALVNVVDYPELCDAFTPSIVDRDPVVVAIGTEGHAPVLGRLIKTRVEEVLHPRLGAFAALAGRLRAEVARHVPLAERRVFWRWVFAESPWKTFAAGNERDAVGMVKTAIGSGTRRAHTGRLCIVTGVTSVDLVPLGVVDRLQEADVVFADREIPTEVMERARRDATRCRFGVDSCRAAFRNGALTQAVNLARKNQSVVYLSTAPTTVSLPSDQDAVIEHFLCAGFMADARRVATATAAT
ncbi:MAG: NAD(P)-dependent oxidoreductase [Pseudomonadota bacterium]